LPEALLHHIHGPCSHRILHIDLNISDPSIFCLRSLHIRDDFPLPRHPSKVRRSLVRWYFPLPPIEAGECELLVFSSTQVACDGNGKRFPVVKFFRPFPKYSKLSYQFLVSWQTERSSVGAASRWGAHPPGLEPVALHLPGL